MGRNTEPDPDRSLRPGNRMGLRQFLDTVLPWDPGLHLLRDGWGADRQLPHLLRQQAPGLTLGESWTFGHAPGYRTGVRMPRAGWMTTPGRDFGVRKQRHPGPGWSTRQCGQTSSATSLLDPTWCLSIGGSR